MVRGKFLHHNGIHTTGMRFFNARSYFIEWPHFEWKRIISNNRTTKHTVWKKILLKWEFHHAFVLYLWHCCSCYCCCMFLLLMLFFYWSFVCSLFFLDLVRIELFHVRSLFDALLLIKWTLMRITRFSSFSFF